MLSFLAFGDGFEVDVEAESRANRLDGCAGCRWMLILTFEGAGVLDGSTYSGMS